MNRSAFRNFTKMIAMLLMALHAVWPGVAALAYESGVDSALYWCGRVAPSEDLERALADIVAASDEQPADHAGNSPECQACCGRCPPALAPTQLLATSAYVGGDVIAAPISRGAACSVSVRGSPLGGRAPPALL